jgi:primosomal protein N' (replication factor Y) (superfamily II helicase)
LRLRKGVREARVRLLIPTRALPPMSYRVPDDLADQVQVGSAVVVPLSGYSRLGVVVEVVEVSPDRPLEEVRRIAGGLSLGPELVGLCDWVSENSALSRPVVLRNALPPGLRIDLYRVVAPAPDWSWLRGSLVERSALRKSLGKDGLKEAEAGGRVALSPAPARRESVEWVVPGESEPSLARAPRQRELFEKIRSRGTCRVRSLLEETGARRETLKSLADRGAVRIERRSGASPVIAAQGPGETPHSGVVQEIPERGRYLWRVSGEEEAMAVAGFCRAAVKRWEQTLVLAPEVRDVERLVSELAGLLPAGTTIAPYHSGLGRERAAVYEAVRQGAVDVLVGTRTAALLPLSRPGAICVVDEPNPAHRAGPGFEGIPLHVRELALERGNREGAAVLLLSPAPSLALYAAARSGEVRELPTTEPASWPEARVVDMRGSGAAVGRDLVEACREGMVEDGGVGVVVNRLGYATAVSCAQCGVAVACGSCGLPLVLHGGSGMGELRGEMVCHQCAARAAVPRNCSGCGSERLVPTGLAVERVRDLLAERLGGRVGLATAERHSRPDARVIVGTAHEIFAKSWDTVLVPDADSLLLGGGVLGAERGFRALYSAAASARRRVAVQTRDPENAVLEAALRGDYPAFAALELPRRRRAGYPPYRHLAALTLEGEESAVRRAVESVLRLRESGVEALEPVPLADVTRADAWRVVLRARRRSDLAQAVSLTAELPPSGSACGAANGSPRGEARRIQIELDPEEV